MANEEHIKRLLDNVYEFNSWREDNPEIEIELSGANLREANLREADLDHANLEDADLYGADLSYALLGFANLIAADLSHALLGSADLSKADLSYADLSGADLSHAIFRDANLSNTNINLANFNGTILSGANLSETLLFLAHFNGTDLSRANLYGAECYRTTFANVDLSNVKGLPTVRHRSPSTLGVDTLYRSKGKIPREFLKGCGLTDTFIDYIPSLIDSLDPIQFYSCFISYSTLDEDFTTILYDRLQHAGLRIWYAPEELKAGRKIHEEIDKGIRLHDKLLVVLSENSIKSNWVESEIRKARKRELRENRRILFPIRLIDMEALQAWELFDADEGRDLAVELREYYIPDFSNWKDDPKAFEKELVKLLDALKQEDPPTPENAG